MTGDDGDRWGESFAYHLANGTWPPRDAHVLRVVLEATVAAGAATRRALEGHLLERVDAEELELLKILACELVNNAVIYGGDAARNRVELWIGAAPRCIRVEVSDGGSGFERPASPSPREIGGFGVTIVDRVASRWGVAVNAGSCVWFELDR